MKPVIIHGQAKVELSEAIAFYEHRQSGLGQALQKEVERVVQAIQRHPKSSPPYKDTGFRHQPVRRFPYVIFYVELTDTIWIAAVAHQKRRPDYWRRRRTQ
ncbi:MAG: type II toxin-antitoxin system RelE/ParE family toxin [Thermodesulfobacteriota bacterium]